VLLPGLAQVHVHVDQSRRDDEAGRHLNDARTLHGQVLADAGHEPALDTDVEVTVTAGLGVDHTAAPEHECLSRSFHQLTSSPANRYKTAMRTATPLAT